MTPPIKTVAVVSTGVIGSSFVALFLSRGLRVLVCSPSGSPTAEAKLAAYLAGIWPTLDPATLSPAASLSNWTFVGASLDGYWDQVDLVQENTPENLELKRAIIAELDAKLRPGVPILSSTSGIVASRLVTECQKHPERVLVGHPYNPPHLIPLVEVVPHPGTDAGVVDGVVAFYRSVGRTPVVVKKELPGFVANRLQAVLLREAFTLVLDGVVTAEEVGECFVRMIAHLLFQVASLLTCSSDMCVTEGPGLRWPFVGPFMGSVLGGGGGKDAFKHMQTHIGASAQVWFDDIDSKSVRLAGDMEKIDKLDESVQKMLEGVDTTEVKKEFGKSLTHILQFKSASSGNSS